MRASSLAQLLLGSVSSLDVVRRSARESRNSDLFDASFRARLCERKAEIDFVNFDGRVGMGRAMSARYIAGRAWVVTRTH
jgi:hypothetical protein